MSDQLRINGALVGWPSTILKIGGERYTGVTSLSYSDKIEVVSGYGMARHHAPRGDSPGKYTADNTKLRVHKSTGEAIRSQLALLAPDKRSYGLVRVVINVQFIEPGSELPMNHVMHGCRLVVDGAQHEENPDPLQEDLEFYTRYIVRNGKTLFDSTRGLP